jgi:hypothetical protein
MVGAVCALVVACGSATPDGATQPNGSHRSATCPVGPLPSTLLAIPFTPERRPFTAWLDDQRAIVAELYEPSDGTNARVRAFVVDAGAGRAHALPDPLLTVRPSTGSPNAVFAVVERRLLVVTYSTVGTEPTGAAMVDPQTGSVETIRSAGAPPSAAFLTSPRAIAVSGAIWAFWPRKDDTAFDLEHGYALDTGAMAWRALPRVLEARHASHVATLGDGRVAVWGGIVARDRRPAVDGVTLDLASGRTRAFAHPGVAGSLTAVSGSRVATAIVTAEGLRGYVVDVDSRRSQTFERTPALSWRNREVLTLDGERVGYLGADALHVWSIATAAWEAHDLPFDPDLPSEIALHRMGDGYWLLDGTPQGAFRVDAGGRFCPIPLPEGDPTPTGTVLVSPRYHVRLGGVALVHAENDCPPGAPCAQPAPTRHEDPRARVTTLP